MKTRRESNDEFVRRIMSFGCPTGALIQVMVMQSLDEFSKAVLASTEPWNNQVISEEAWKETARFIQRELGTFFGRKADIKEAT